MTKIRKITFKIFIYTCVCILGVGLLMPSFSQGQDRERPRFEIESDPLAYIFSGYSLHNAITYSGFRSSIGIFAIKPPDFLVENDAFSVYTSGFDFKTDYLFGDINGFYAGIQLTYTKDRIILKNKLAEKDELQGLNLGIRAGYRFMFGKKENQHKGFYLTPWVALMYNPSPKSVQQAGQEYRQATWVPFPTLHFGWRF